MPSFENHSFLLVDDHNFSRITVLRTLKNMGDPRTHSATHGMEALDILETMASIMDCVIADFNMPVMHGLQLLKSIRCGERDIPPDLPVIMLTAHGDTNLVQIALSLDVSGFVLKPATADALGKRLQQALQQRKKSRDWLKPVDTYKNIDVDSPIEDLLEFKQLSDMKQTNRKPVHVKALCCSIDTVRAGSILAPPLTTSTGQVLVNAGQSITVDTIEKLRNLQEVGIQVDEIWVKESTVGRQE